MENESIKELEELKNKVNEWNNAKREPTQLVKELEQVLQDMSSRYFGNNLHANEIYLYWSIVMDLDNGNFTEQQINKLTKYIYNIWLESDTLSIKNITDTILELSEEMTVKQITEISYNDFINLV